MWQTSWLLQFILRGCVTVNRCGPTAGILFLSAGCMHVRGEKGCPIAECTPRTNADAHMHAVCATTGCTVLHAVRCFSLLPALPLYVYTWLVRCATCSLPPHHAATGCVRLAAGQPTTASASCVVLHSKADVCVCGGCDIFWQVAVQLSAATGGFRERRLQGSIAACRHAFGATHAAPEGARHVQRSALVLSCARPFPVQGASAARLCP